MLTKERLEQAKPEVEKVLLLDDCVYVRDMGGTARDLWEQSVQYHREKCGDKGYPHFRASLVLRTLCDEQGNLLYTPEEIKKVSAFPAKILSKLYDVGARLSGVTKEDAKQLGEDLTASEDSTSDSPGT
jgi:hypothetical protein